MTQSTLIKQLQEKIKRAISRIRLPFRGVLTKTDTAPSVMLVQADGLNGEKLQAAEYMQHYGLSSHPPAGSQLVVVPIGGVTSHSVILATEHGHYRIKALKEGEVALYDDQDQAFIIHRDGMLAKTSKTFEVDADKINLHAASEFKFDVNGQGEKWDGQGVETWRDDDVPRPHHDHQPPRIP